jgi:hypothetical protein
MPRLILAAVLSAALCACNGSPAPAPGDGDSSDRTGDDQWSVLTWGCSGGHGDRTPDNAPYRRYYRCQRAEPTWEDDCVPCEPDAIWCDGDNGQRIGERRCQCPRYLCHYGAPCVVDNSPRCTD